MAVLPTFDPQGTPGEVGTMGMRAGSEAASLMERAQMSQRAERQLQLQEQQHEMQRQAWEMQRPAMEAKNAADIATFGASIANTTHMQMLRKQAADVAPQAQAEFADAAKLADWDAQDEAMQELQAKYSWMGNFPEYKGFLDTIDHARANAALRAITNQRLDEARDMNAAKLEAMQEMLGMKGQTSEKVQRLKNEGLVASSSIRANAPTGFQKDLNQFHAAMEDGDQQAVDFYFNRLSGGAKITAEQYRTLQGFVALKQKAIANGDDAGVAQIDAKIKEIEANILQSHKTPVAGQSFPRVSWDAAKAAGRPADSEEATDTGADTPAEEATEPPPATATQPVVPNFKKLF